MGSTASAADRAPPLLESEAVPPTTKKATAMAPAVSEASRREDAASREAASKQRKAEMQSAEQEQHDPSTTRMHETKRVPGWGGC